MGALVRRCLLAVLPGLTVLASACDRGSQAAPAPGTQSARVEAAPAPAADRQRSPAGGSEVAPRFAAAKDVDADLVIAYTASVVGFVEPCGCSLRGGEMGGVARRATLVDSLRAAGTPVLLVEAGDFAGGTGGTGPRLVEASVEAMKAMGYDVLALGEAELAFGESFLQQLAVSGIPVAHANWAHPALGPAQQDGLIVEVAGRKIGVIGILDPEALPADLGLEKLVVDDPALATAAAAASLRSAGAELVLVLGHASFRRSGRVAAEAGAPDLWIVGHGGKELAQPQSHEGVLLLGPGSMGKMVGLLDVQLASDSGPLYTHRLHPLAEEMVEKPSVAALVKAIASSSSDGA